MLGLKGLAVALGVVSALGCAPTIAPAERAPVASAAPGCRDLAAVTKLSELLALGRIARATAAFSKLPAECAPELGDAWGDIALAQAELGRAEPARAEAERISRSPIATPTAKTLAARALEHSSRYATPGGDLHAMLDVYDRALDAEHTGDTDTAGRTYLEAWSRFRPNAAALVRAGRIAQKTGDRARAQRLYDRALAELEAAGAKPPRASLRNPDEHLSSPFARWIGDGSVFAAVLDDGLRIFDSQTFELLTAPVGWSRSTAHSADGRLLAIQHGDEQKQIDVVHVRSGHRVASFATEGSASGSVVASPSFSRLAVSSGAKTIEVFDLRAGRRIAKLSAPDHGEIAFLDDTLLWGSFDRNKRQICWNIEDGSVRWQHELSEAPHDARSLADRFVYVVLDSRKNRLSVVALDLRTGKAGKPLELRELRELHDFALASHDTLVVTRPGETSAYLLDTWKLIAKLPFGKASERTKVRRGWPGAVILTAIRESATESQIWEPASGRLRPFVEPRLPSSPFEPYDHLPSGRTVTVIDLHTIEVTEPDGTRRRLSRARPQPLHGVAVRPGGTSLLLGDGRGIRTLPFATPKLGWLGARGLPNADLGHTDDGRWLLASGDALVVLDAKSGAIHKRLAHAGARDARITPDGSVVIALGTEASVIWDLRTGQSVPISNDDEPDPRIARLAVAASCCGGALTLGPNVDQYISDDAELNVGVSAFSADGSRIAIAHSRKFSRDDEQAEDEGISVFDTRSGKRIATLGGMLTPGEIALDRPGRRLATSSVVGIATLYHVDQRKPFDLGPTVELSFSRDGRLLVGLDGASAKVWRTADGALLGTIALSANDEKSGVFIASDGRVDWIGKPASIDLGCHVGDTELPFDVCADRLVTPGLLAASLR